MRSKRSSLSMALPVFLLLSWHGCVQAFSFCFSSGLRDSQQAQYNSYLPPLPGNLPGLYGGYPYSPAPAYTGDGGYFSPPYEMPAAKPLPVAPESRTYYE
jgi:hypothetical protein